MTLAEAPIDNARSPAAPGAAARTLRVITYNVRYFGHATRGLASTGPAFRRIARSLAALDPLPDLICLQEVETQSLRSTTVNRLWHPAETQLDRVMSELHAALARAKKPERFTAYYFPAHTYRLTQRTNIYTTGLAVIASNALDIGHHNAGQPHDITHRVRAKKLKQTRICAHISFKHRDGFTFDVFNTHLSLPNIFSKEFWTEEARMGFGPNQLVEAKTLADFVAAQKRCENYIVVGDFNALPGSPVDCYLREERGLVDAFTKVQGFSPAESRDYPTAGFLNLRMHLDHVYSAPGLEWLDFEDTRRFGEAGAFSGLSDHVPLIARLRVPLAGEGRA